MLKDLLNLELYSVNTRIFFAPTTDALSIAHAPAKNPISGAHYHLYDAPEMTLISFS